MSLVPVPLLTETLFPYNYPSRFPTFEKMNTLPKADSRICLKFYHIFYIRSTYFRQHFPLLAFGTLYHSLTLPLFWPVLYLKYRLLRLVFDSHTENASSSQHQVSWKQCVLHLWWNNIKFWFRMSLCTPRWQISP